MVARRVAVITGSRAEYGLLEPTIARLAADPRVELELLVTGAHLDARFGSTIEEIKRDGHRVAGRVDLALEDTTPAAITRALSRAVGGFGERFAQRRPAVALVLGDRYEIFGAAQAAMIARIPLAHVHGGEATEGLIDESIRHALSKMSHLHFVAAEPYRRRLLRMGERPDRIWTVGALALEHLRRAPEITAEAAAASLGIELGEPLLLVTYHPVTLMANSAVDALLDALDRWPMVRVMFTGTNADPDGDAVARAIAAWVGRNAGRATHHLSLGRARYTALMRAARAVVGNSSSGIIEAPAVGTPTVNIGPRQDGRLRAPSIIDCPAEPKAISAAIGRALGASFQAAAARAVTPYAPKVDEPASATIARVLATQPLEELLIKRFNDGVPR